MLVYFLETFHKEFVALGNFQVFYKDILQRNEDSDKGPRESGHLKQPCADSAHGCFKFLVTNFKNCPSIDYVVNTCRSSIKY